MLIAGGVLLIILIKNGSYSLETQAVLMIISFQFEISGVALAAQKRSNNWPMVSFNHNGSEITT